MVPVWNEEGRLARLLDRLERCEPPPEEVVVADGGSADGSRAVAGDRARWVDAPRGRAQQQNAGAGASGSAILWFVHADTLPPPSAVAEIRSAVATGAPGGAFAIAFPAEERARSRWLGLIQAGINARTRVTRTATGDQAIFVTRDAFERIGGFPPWPLFEDVALFTRLGRLGRPALCEGPVETSARRWLDEGVARTMARMWALRIAYAMGASPAGLARWWRHEPPS